MIVIDEKRSFAKIQDQIDMRRAELEAVDQNLHERFANPDGNMYVLGNALEKRKNICEELRVWQGRMNELMFVSLDFRKCKEFQRQGKDADDERSS
jgi:hypothetical protein